MAIVVVGGSGRNVGKTSLVCGLIAALPEFCWIAVKITSHAHGVPEPIWEETEPGQATDTARYLAAGAQRAFFVTASDAEISVRVRELQSNCKLASNWIFESNRILDSMQPNLCLAVKDDDGSIPKPSFIRITHFIDATVVRARRDRIFGGAKPHFEMTDLLHVPPEMEQWLRARLTPSRS